MCTSKRMVPGDRKALWQTLINTLTVMVQGRCLAVQYLARLANITAVDVQYALPKESLDERRKACQAAGNSLSHADAEDGNLSSKVPDSITTKARICLWVARARADHQLGRLLGDELVKSDLVIPVYRDGGTFQHEVLVDIVREGVVVVDEDEVGGGGEGRRWFRVVGRVINDLQRSHLEADPEVKRTLWTIWARIDGE